MIEGICFYLFAALLIFFAYKVVSTDYVLRAATYLIISLLLVAGLYILLNAEFVAAIQILVYVGGIVVITIFAIFLVSRVGAPAVALSMKTKILSGVVVFAVVVVGIQALVTIEGNVPGMTLDVDARSDNARKIGEALLSVESNGFILPFEIVSLLLLGVLIGAVITARTKPE